MICMDGFQLIEKHVNVTVNDEQIVDKKISFCARIKDDGDSGNDEGNNDGDNDDKNNDGGDENNEGNDDNNTQECNIDHCVDCKKG